MVFKEELPNKPLLIIQLDSIIKLEDACLSNKKNEIKGKEFYDHFILWYEMNGKTVWSNTKFGKDNWRTSTYVYYKRIRFK